MELFKLKTKHFLTGEELTLPELDGLLTLASELKRSRAEGDLTFQPWRAKTLAMVFEKPSLRTRMSFTVATQELGGFTVESTQATSKHEEPEDLIRVVAGYAHAAMVRTHGHDVLERMISKSPIPVINGLSNVHHPCQVLADALTIQETFGELKGVTVAYIGDGNNMLHSLALLLPFLGVNLRFACPSGYEPDSLIIKRAKKRLKEGRGGSIEAFATPEEAAKGAHVLYTDVWISMGFEKETSARETAFEGYQVNEALLALAKPNAAIMHCLPMLRGKEITDSVVEHPQSVIFKQSENRLHTQKALLAGMLPA